MLKNALLALALVLLLVLSWTLFQFTFHGALFRRAGDLDSIVLLTKVQNLNQLVTVKYVLEKVVNYNDPKWYGDNRVLLVAHGVVKAGIDLAMLKPGDIKVAESDTDKEISLTLPPPRITDVYLDDHGTEVIERSTGMLRTFDKDLEQNARTIAVAELREAAAKDGILGDASERAKVELTGLLYQLGFTKVDFRDK